MAHSHTRSYTLLLAAQTSLTKEEVERLLRHGAYDMFTEENTGAAEAESNAFVEQDIDSILERRTKTITHESAASKNAAGSTFSKASFKAPKTPDKNKAQEDVDLDDPDFWRKIVGEGTVEEEKEDLSGKKRTRHAKNYSEKAYEKEMDSQLLLSGDDEDSDSSSVASDGSYNSSSDNLSDIEMESDLGPSSDPASALPGASIATNAQRGKSRKRKAEPRRWERKKGLGFEKGDAERVFKGLLAHGYGNLAWESFRSKLSLQKYSAAEVSLRIMPHCLDFPFSNVLNS